MSRSIAANNTAVPEPHAELLKDRWTGFEKQSGILKIYRDLHASDLRRFKIFNEFDDSFLLEISPDISVSVWDRGKVLFEEGSYLDLAFYVVKGEVNIFIEKQVRQNGKAGGGPGSRASNGKNSSRKQGINSLPETVFQSQIRQARRDPKLTFLSSMDIDLPWGNVVNLGRGEIFGETGASIGWPQSVTARTSTKCVLVQIRIPALEKMKRESATLKQHLDQIYVERALTSQLKSTPIFQKCPVSFVEEVKQRVELKSCRRNEAIVKEGEAMDAAYLVRSGFVKLSQKMEEGEIVVNYLSKGMTLGDAEFFGGQGRWLFTATSVENTELVKIPLADFSKLINNYPDAEKLVWNASVARLKESGLSRKNIARSEFLQQALENGLVEGNSVLIIDLETCTRCDDCVRGCADTHGGTPRFVREGEKYDDFLITRACYHCTDPVCLVGCPTGAIRRAGVNHVVEIEEELCIGCKSCFHKCPYDAITMVETGGENGSTARPVNASQSPTEELVATKCDLCYSSEHGPACVYNCPHGCATRIETVENFSQLLEEKSSFPRPWNLVQSRKWLMAFLIALAALSAGFVLNITLAEVNSGNAYGLTFGTLAAILMVGAGLLGIRRRTMRMSTVRSLGSATSWVQFHLYGGTLFLFSVLMHTGFRVPNGSFYSWLWGLSLWVVVGGLIGVLCQKLIPKILSSGLAVEVIYERIPELVKDLHDEAEALISDCSQPVGDFYWEHIHAFMDAPMVNPIFFVDISGGILRQTRRFNHLRSTLTDEDKQRLTRLQELLKTKTEIDVHYTLQKVLRWWLFAHLPVSIVLILLVLVHLAAVLYY